MARRSFLLGVGSIIAGYFALRYGPALIGRAIGPPFDFAPLDDPKGFRRISAGQSSGRIDPLIGLDPSQPRRSTAEVAAVRARLCDLLFEQPPAGTVPVASFSDYNCPFCRVLTQQLAELAEPEGLHIAWHELPLLGDTSLLAAQAAIAAKQQGAYVAFHQRMMRSRFQATPEYLEQLAEMLGLDVDRFVRDATSAKTAAQIEQSATLAQIFRFIGTPALVVGRTVVQGAILQSDLSRLIDLERAAGPVDACV